MTDVNRDEDLGEPNAPSADGEADDSFHTDTASANEALHRGMGVGARELAAQRDPQGGATSPDDDIPIHQPDDISSLDDSNGRA